MRRLYRPLAESFRDDLVACLDLNRLFCYVDLSNQILHPDARPIDCAPVSELVDDGDVLKPCCNRGRIPCGRCCTPITTEIFLKKPWSRAPKDFVNDEVDDLVFRGHLHSNWEIISDGAAFM